MIEIKTTEVAEDAKRVPLFSIDGTTYSIPEVFPANWGLRFVHYSATRGVDAASAWLLGTAVGAEGYDALLSCDALTRPQLDEIVDTVVRHAVGKDEQPPSGGDDSGN